MFPPFSQELAYHYNQILISELESGNSFLQKISNESEERKNQGIMIGTLVCFNKNKQRIILHAVSGISNILVLQNNQDIPKRIVVPPIVDIKKIEHALKKNDKKIHVLTKKINNYFKDKTKTQKLITKRTKLTDYSLKKVFSLYNFTRFDKTKISLNIIIKNHNNKFPPTGTGDCCAPKLLSFAFKNELFPISMDEVFYGNDTKNKINKTSYFPCDERCGFILPEILGVEVLYRDNDIIVVNKKSGLLSVPGIKQKDCIENRIKKLFGYSNSFNDNSDFGDFQKFIEPCAVHRLDMETSGILIFARNKSAHKNLNQQFREGKVTKKYIALLDGILYGKGEGIIELKFRLDINNRPYQIYDEINGKLSITEYKKLKVESFINPITKKIKKVTRIEFTPKTGRTHQLRLASSHIKGLNIPIVGDSLYGKCKKGERLMLHAFYIDFFHPTSNEKISFNCKVPF